MLLVNDQAGLADPLSQGFIAQAVDVHQIEGTQRGQFFQVEAQTADFAVVEIGTGPSADSAGAETAAAASAAIELVDPGQFDRVLQYRYQLGDAFTAGDGNLVDQAVD